MKIGLIGCGELGCAIAQNMLRAGHQLMVYDPRQDAVAKAVALGAAAAASAAALAGQVEAVLTALPTPAIIEDVILGSGLVLERMKPGTVWIDHSTNDHRLLQRIAGLAPPRGVAIIEAPVTGGIPLAHAGNITVLVGADEPVYTQYRHLLAVVGDPILHMGPVGSATIVKLITNMLALIHLWALGEGLMLGTAAGMETGAVYAAIRASCGDSFVAETEGPPILDGSYDYGFTLDLAAKDIGLAMQLGRQYNVPLEMGNLAQQLFQRAIGRYGGKFWSTGIVKMLEDDLGIDLRAGGFTPAERWLPYKKGGKGDDSPRH